MSIQVRSRRRSPRTVLPAAALLLCFIAAAGSCQVPPRGWDALPSLLASIRTPVFPDRTLLVTDFGARGDGTTDCTGAFRRAIDSCAAAGGGTVVVPSGRFLTGALFLKSRVNLHVTRDATIAFVTDPRAYLPVVFTRWEGVECMNYAPLISADGQHDIAITGSGTLDGQASRTAWWPWSGKTEHGWMPGLPRQKADRESLFSWAERGLPPERRVFGEGHYLRPNFFQPYRCSTVLVDGVTFRGSPMWFLHPVLCNEVTVRRVTVEGLGPNNDGCDPESSRNVLIDSCFFNTGDDCIAIKSGRNADGRRLGVPSENIVVRRCVMREGHGGVVLGSEVSGGVRNVYAEECIMDSPHLDRAIRFKTNSIRGGVLEDVWVRNIRVGQVADAVLKVDFYYEEGDAGDHTPVLRNVELRDVTCARSTFAVWIRAYDRSPVRGLRLERCTFDQVAQPSVLEHVENAEMVGVRINGEIFGSPAHQPGGTTR